MNNDVQTQTGSIPFNSADRNLGVLVGYDGSEHAQLALFYAARAAQRRNTVLTVVAAFAIPAMVHTAMIGVPDIPEEQLKRQVAESSLEEARELLTGYPGEVIYRAEQGDASGVLVDLSASAELVVVGARGRGGFLGRILGSVATALPSHAKCPTVVVPREYQSEISGEGAERFDPVASDAPVVVGVEGSSFSRVAALHAARAAADRGVALRMVMALPPMDGALMWYPDLAPREDRVAERRKASLAKALEAEVTWLTGHYPGLEVIPSVEEGDPVTVLHQATKTAQLTVVGTHGRNSLVSALIGSVARGALIRAEGPVMIVPRLEDARLQNQPHFTG